MESGILITLAFSLLALVCGAVLGWLVASRPRAVFEERARLLADQLQQVQVAQAENEGQARERVRSLTETLEERATHTPEEVVA